MRRPIKFCAYCGSAVAQSLLGGAPQHAFTCVNCGETVDHPDYASPALLVLTHVVAQDRMLLMRRGADPYKGKWAPPGGYVGHGESVERAAIREVWEEVRVKLECTQLLPYAVTSIPAINQVYHIFAVALAKMLPATAVPPESIDVGWFTRQQLRRLDLWEPAARVDHESLFAGARTGHFNFYQESGDFSRMIRRHGEIEYLS